MRPIDPNDEGVDGPKEDPSKDTSSDIEQSEPDAEVAVEGADTGVPDEEDQEEEIQEMGRSKRKRVQTSRGSDSFILSSTRSSTRIAATRGRNTGGNRRIKKPISLLSSD